MCRYNPLPSQCRPGRAAAGALERGRGARSPRGMHRRSNAAGLATGCSARRLDAATDSVWRPAIARRSGGLGRCRVGSAAAADRGRAVTSCGRASSFRRRRRIWFPTAPATGCRAASDDCRSRAAPPPFGATAPDVRVPAAASAAAGRCRSRLGGGGGVSREAAGLDGSRTRARPRGHPGRGKVAPAAGCVVRASGDPPRHRGGDGDCGGGRCAGAADRGCGVPRGAHERRAGRGLAHGRGGTDAGRPRAPFRGVAARHDAVGRRSDVRAERAVDGAGDRRVLRTDGRRTLPIRRCAPGRGTTWRPA